MTGMLTRRFARDHSEWKKGTAVRSFLSVLLALPAFMMVSRGVVLAGAEDYQAYCLYLAGQDYPDGNPAFDQDVQGVAHDANNWFITQTGHLWKIPVHLPLGSVDADDSGVLDKNIDDYSVLRNLGYEHFGDPVVYQHEGTDYLLVPIEHDEIHLPGAVAIFTCSGLSYIDHVVLPPQVFDAGWCAVDDDGFLYSSRQHASSIFKYSLDWDQLQEEGSTTVTVLEEITLYNEAGTDSLDLITMQGGEFAPGSRLLYLLSGFHDDNDEEQISEGIHVMDTTTWRRVAHSTNGYGYFNFDYATVFDGEPEGLTVWDLDDGRAPGIRGQLHVFMLDNDFFDDLTFYHYTNVWRVDSGSPCGTGEPTCPFRTLDAASDVIFNRSEMRIRADIYPETGVFTKRVRMTAQGGVVRIGG